MKRETIIKSGRSMRVMSVQDAMRMFDFQVLLEEAVKLDDKLKRRRDRIAESLAKTHERQATKNTFLRSQLGFLEALCELSARRVERRTRSLASHRP